MAKRHVEVGEMVHDDEVPCHAMMTLRPPLHLVMGRVCSRGSREMEDAETVFAARLEEHGSYELPLAEMEYASMAAGFSLRPDVEEGVVGEARALDQRLVEE